MKTPRTFLSCTTLTLSLLLTACSGGGSSDTPGVEGNLECSPGAFLPEVPSGLGVAGVMDGTWRVVTVDLLPDARTRNPDPGEGYGTVGERFTFRDGLMYFETGGAGSGGTTEPTNNPNLPNVPQIEVTFEFACNEVANAITLYGLGVRFADNPIFGPAVFRQCAVFGTTSATTAEAIVVEEQVVGGLNPVDRFTVRRLVLERDSSSPLR
ncbi:MAG: hypothetical protein NXI31_25180 [bacterium]|nr:hypothetical protein [bacterium]